MPRWFNTAGPCVPADHYMLPATARLPELRPLIEQKKYFVVHAPRQVGKTTALLTLAWELTAEGRYTALLVSMESGSPFSDDVGAAEDAILDGWRAAAERWLPSDLAPPPWPEAPVGRRVGRALQAWAMASRRPLVLFLDEIDALRDRTLASVLRQLREGYPGRPDAFPWSLALIGLRDVRDYRIATGDRAHAGTASPFNILARSLTMRNFTRDEVAELYAQHTADTGQAFTPEAVDRVFALTQGQPWLVNALAAVVVDELATDPSAAVSPADVDRAREILVQRQETHLDSLAERLREPRVRAILEPMLAGGTPAVLPPDDIRFVLDLGLLRMSETGGIEVANPIYREIIARDLAASPRASLPSIHPSWLRPDGRLDPERLLDAFLAFWRRHGEPLLRTAPYHEIAPHLVLLAFLERVANGGGTIEREYAIGRGRMDLCLRYGPDTVAIELKVWRDGRPDPIVEGLEQIDRYLAGLGLLYGWLVIFDQREGQPPLPERTAALRRTTASGRDVVVIRA
ncbi:ATP-binding protein [Sorangium sp. So ce854]|uniref:ATP-binding protein n=1 Tax=Sorangium sp. So ce854 TaxID=3133322 RepID=UPI003F6091A7